MTDRDEKVMSEQDFADEVINLRHRAEDSMLGPVGDDAARVDARNLVARIVAHDAALRAKLAEAERKLHNAEVSLAAYARDLHAHVQGRDALQGQLAEEQAHADRLAALIFEANGCNLTGDGDELNARLLAAHHDHADRRAGGERE